MDYLLNIPVFLASIVVISLSGVMMPGPVMAVTIAKGRESGNAGMFIALGHGVIEIPLMLVIYFGFAQFFVNDTVTRIIGLVGGVMLLYMGLQMFRTRYQIIEEPKKTKFSSLFSGVLTTGANPYFFLWWVTIGSALVINSTLFGPIGFLLFAIVHWLCDFFWYLFVSKAVNKSQKFWNSKIHQIVFGICGAILLVFGAWFVYTALIQ